MANQKVTFGYTVQAFGRPPEPGQTAAQAFQELITRNEQFIAQLPSSFDTVWVEDHLQWGIMPTAECWTTLTYLMAKYPNLKFGHIVLGQSYRNPALTAKMASVLQVMSGGRLILGLGAGWKEDEYRAYGYEYPPASVRIEQLDDTCAILRAMFTTSPATYQGKHYQVENVYNEPRPDQPIPLLIGGGGEKRTLRVVAQYADWWNLPFSTVDEYARKQDALHRHCQELGRDFATIKQTYSGLLQVVADPADIRPVEGFYQIAGTVAQVTTELQQFIDLGVTHFMFRIVGFKMDSFMRFVNEVQPNLRMD
jgi:alkanesulfonate monooxygenase SsuD/methylene tetrahydromethanopterin reductase-like flavin-dependent oxidoreductase (luciferase family)